MDEGGVDVVDALADAVESLDGVRGGRVSHAHDFIGSGPGGFPCDAGFERPCPEQGNGSPRAEALGFGGHPLATESPHGSPPPIPVSAPATPLPLRFNRPQGWPEPSVDWLAANQGWDPPVGWAPAPGVAPAPAGWVWWARDEVGWKAMTGGVTSRFRNGAVVSAVVFAVGGLLTVLPATLHLTVSFFFWGR
ncbi:hypothetical protein GCM10025867_03590 [Frondihabitans sucicola]|uniref:DUF2510 domain-containing protein n=1 Tax=Frondihabitans sucicola TaxID=1268041 RepID=A0ABN6XT61_9MICO|nr:hypothetical protein GCM10025867_03590 [Frondihabitans sucicola]